MPQTDLTTTPAGGIRTTDRVPAAARTVFELLDQMSGPLLHVETPDKTVRTFAGDRSGAPVTLTIHDWQFFRQVIGAGGLGLGESYMAGHWSSDDPVGLHRMLIANRDAVDKVGLRTIAGAARAWVHHRLRRNIRSNARQNIQAHYDLSNELYRIFLDDTMTYSSAVFDSPDMTLQQAQERKYATLADRLNLEPGMHVLEIGCGWGGFAIWAARTHGVRVTGITLSDDQYELATERVAEAGLTDQIDLQIVDYRDVAVPDGGYDRVVSIEMLEAVGHEFLGDYFAAVDRALSPDGIAAIQVITMPDQRYRNYRRRPDFIRRYVFPGGHLPSLDAMTEAMRKRSDLIVHDITDIGMDYAETLRRWRKTFLGNLDAVRAAGFDDVFIRRWDYYLLSCEAAFAERWVINLQMTLTRVRNTSLGTAHYTPAPIPSPTAP